MRNVALAISILVNFYVIYKTQEIITYHTEMEGIYVHKLDSVCYQSTFEIAVRDSTIKALHRSRDDYKRFIKRNLKTKTK